MALFLRLIKHLPKNQISVKNLQPINGGINSIIFRNSTTCSTKLSHDERNMKLGRPMSPHLTIYKPQLTSMLSISHRGAGLVLSGYMTALGLAPLILSCPISYYVDVINSYNLSPGIIIPLKFLLALPVTFHTLNGLRHLSWDMGKFLTIKEVYSTGWTVVTLSVIAAAGLALL